MRPRSPWAGRFAQWLLRTALFTVLVIGIAGAGTPAFAAEALSRQPTAITVPAHENVDTVFAVGHPLWIRGVVTNSVIAVGGDIHLLPGSVTAFVLSIGGHVIQSQGALVTEGVFAVGGNNRLVTTLTLASLLSVGGYFLRTTLAAALFFILLAGGNLVYARDEQISAWIGRKYLRLLGTGVMISVAPAILLVASFGTPLIWVPTIAVGFLYTLLGFGGLVFVSNKIGRTVLYAMQQPTRRILALYGSLAILFVTNVPLVGVLVTVALWLLGVGTMWTVIFRRGLTTPPEA